MFCFRRKKLNGGGFQKDDFNLTGLSTMVPYYEYALDMILDVEMPMEDSLTEEQQEIMESAAEMLYGLIHARYVSSSGWLVCFDC
jgi:casein kinase II subunit beta